MVATTIANVLQTLQSAVVDILRADVNSLTFTHRDNSTDGTSLSSQHILDGVPTGLQRGEGFPYIIVHTPEMDETWLTLRKQKIELNVHVEIIDRMEQNVRILTDGVRKSMSTNNSVLQSDGYWLFGRRIRTNLNYVFLPGELGMKPVWHMNMFFTFLWTGLR